MRTRTSHLPEEQHDVAGDSPSRRTDPAAAMPPRLDSDAGSRERMAMAVQHSAGNQAAVQRLDAGDVLGSVGDMAKAIATRGLEDAFDFVLKKSLATSTGGLAPDPAWDQDIDLYALYNPVDGAKINAGRARHPSFHQDGYILTIQSGAAAITLDTDIFVRSGYWQESTYVHELVHVPQYSAGRAAFVTSYFGLAAAELAKRLVSGKPLDPFTASPQETEAYGVEDRFKAWVKLGKPTTPPPPAAP
ncbi:hypothetical protein GCM10009765_20590 [Fodinicola feengrottensis]|uniref:DUF4157 domain-containing protein n=2 Tax=Fodinicola feengrottensis TaxID=435914 RepID=A0ABN2GHB0_9ACTN